MELHKVLPMDDSLIAPLVVWDVLLGLAPEAVVDPFPEPVPDPIRQTVRKKNKRDREVLTRIVRLLRLQLLAGSDECRIALHRLQHRARIRRLLLQLRDRSLGQIPLGRQLVQRGRVGCQLLPLFQTSHLVALDHQALMRVDNCALGDERRVICQGRQLRRGTGGLGLECGSLRRIELLLRDQVLQEGLVGCQLRQHRQFLHLRAGSLDRIVARGLGLVSGCCMFLVLCGSCKYREAERQREETA
jgi:hypothetical protein